MPTLSQLQIPFKRYFGDAGQDSGDPDLETSYGSGTDTDTVSDCSEDPTHSESAGTTNTTATTTPTLHEIGIRSIFQLSAYRKRITMQTKLQSSAINFLRNRVVEQDDNVQYLQSHVVQVESKHAQVERELENARAELARERSRIVQLTSSRELLLKGRRSLEVANDTLQAEGDRLHVALLVAEAELNRALRGREIGMELQQKLSQNTQDFDDIKSRFLQLESDHARVSLELSDVNAQLCNIEAALDTVLDSASRLEGDYADHSDSLKSLESELDAIKQALVVANRTIDEERTLNAKCQSALKDKDIRAYDLAAELQQAETQLTSLHLAHLDLQREYEKLKEVDEQEKADLELSLFAVELERDILLKHESELEVALGEKSEALTTAEALVDDKCALKNEALSGLRDAREDVCRLTSVLMELEQEMDTAQAELATLRGQLLNYDDLVKSKGDEISQLQAELAKANDYAESLSRQLQGECEAHHETRNDLGNIFRRLAMLTSEKDEAEAKLKDAQGSAQDAKAVLNSVTQKMSLELEHLKSNDQEVELERQEKSQLEVKIQNAVDELTKENRGLEQSKKSVEEAFLAKVHRCEELEKQNAWLEERVQALEKERMIATTHPFAYVQAQGHLLSTPPKRTSDGKENEYAGGIYNLDMLPPPGIVGGTIPTLDASIHDLESQEMSPIRRRSVTTSFLASNDSCRTTPEARTLASRLLNSQSLLKLFSPTQYKKTTGRESGTDTGFLEAFDNVVGISPDFPASPALT